MIYVIDSTAMIAVLRGEIGHQVVRQIIEDTNNTCYAHAINLCEVFYDFVRTSGIARAEQAITDLFRINILERNDLDGGFLAQSWRTKSRSLPGFFGGLLRDCANVETWRRTGHVGSS